MFHNLKVRSEYFNDIVLGIKNFEVRFNDRDFHEGDFIILNETRDGVYTTRFCLVRIIYVFESTDFLKNGYVVLGIEKVKGFSCFDNSILF